MRRKSFKTVSGALRNFEEQLLVLQSKAELAGGPFDWAKEARPVIEHVVAHWCWKAKPDEDISEFLNRMKATPEGQHRAKDINKLLKFAKAPLQRQWVVTTTSITGTSTKELLKGKETIYRGYDIERDDRTGFDLQYVIRKDGRIVHVIHHAVDERSARDWIDQVKQQERIRQNTDARTEP